MLCLTRSINVERSNYSDRHVKRLTKVPANVFRHYLAMTIRIERTNRVALRNRKPLRDAIYIRAQQSNGRMLPPAQLEYIHSPQHVDAIKSRRIFPTIRNIRPARQMKHVTHAAHRRWTL